MLITICYSVLTWLQSRQRQEILSWIDEICVENQVSLVFMKRRLYTLPSTTSNLTTITLSSIGSPSTATFLSTAPKSMTIPSQSPSLNSLLKRPNSSIGFSNDFLSSNNCTASGITSAGTQVSDLCYNYENIKRTRLLWEEDDSRVLALFPLQIVELHHWCAFVGTEIEIQANISSKSDDNNKQQKTDLVLHILLEAEPGFTKSKDTYRKFSQFGRITAWKCGYELALILRSELEQLIELMHIFRLGQIVLEGGWRVYRLTTVTIQGTIGTLISKSDINSTQTSFTPAELRKLQAGIYDCGGESSTSISADTSKQELSKLCSDIEGDSITKLELEEEEDSLKISELPNWHDRSPKKRSIATIHYCERPQSARKRLSLCSNSLSNLSNKSSSLASLLLCSKSISIEEDHRTSSGTSSALNSPAQTPDKESKAFKTRSRKASGPSRQQCSFDSILSTPDRTISSLAIPGSTGFGSGGLDSIRSMSTSTLVAAPTSPLRNVSELGVKSPSRLGKPPNILILAEDSKKRSELARILKSMLANDRYAIYEIRWDQIAVGGWSDQTALLVVAGKIPDQSAISILLQFLGDGGRLFAWCCETQPFGLPISQNSLTNNIVKALTYATTQTQPVHLSGVNWGSQSKQDSTSLPSTFQRVIETNDSEGYSRPLTASTFAKTRDKGDVVIIQLDGGVMGGKAILSQVQFERSMDEDSTLGLLSLILSQNLGLDCTRIKVPEYTEGYLLGDHKVINDFLTSLPATLEQRELALEFIPKGSTKFSKPSHDRFPIHSLKCPSNFSTLNYFENLKTKEIGRLVIYADVLTSTQHIITGHPLKHGLVVIGRRQTCGRGRGKNIWLSPEGSALFSFQLHLDLNSEMGRRITLIQHMAALAIILSIPSHKEINLRVKWPNDIYLDDKKVGGILVESQLQGKTAIINVGIGVNVANAYPTICLNSVLVEKPLNCEIFIAKVLTEFELLQNLVGRNQKLDKLLDLYVENWIHNKEDEINVEVSEGKFTSCNLVGIDEYGFLRVIEISSGHIFSVQPDGNSFDITNRLIAIKNN